MKYNNLRERLLVGINILKPWLYLLSGMLVHTEASGRWLLELYMMNILRTDYSWYIMI